MSDVISITVIEPPLFPEEIEVEVRVGGTVTQFDPGESGVVMLIGPPGVGKTTFAKKYLPGIARVSPDDFRDLHFGGYSGKRNEEDYVWACVEEALFANLRDGIPCYIDATAANATLRQDLLEKMRRWWGAGNIIGVWFQDPLEVCLERNAQRERQVPEDVIRSMHAALEADPPTRREGFSTIIRYTTC